MRTTTGSILLAAAVLVPSAVTAEPVAGGKLDVSFAAGGHFFSKNVELGVDDYMDEPGPSSSGLVGGRVAYRLVKRLSAEAELMLIPTKDDVLGDTATVLGLRAQARFDLLTGKLRPFVVAGYGGHVIRGGSPQMDDDADQAYHWGAGVRFAITKKLDVRVDFRHLIVPDRTSTGATSDYEASAGIGIRFGGAPAPAPRPVVVREDPPPPPKPGDVDGDGLLDDVDACRELAEDLDGFEDDNGCPDPDNDRDGFVDGSDRCVNEAETKNGWQDTDGCPDELIAELTGIGFELSSAKIDADSTALLDRAYEILRDNPSLRVEISGHTSAEGDPDMNLDLSLRRAEAVKTFLVRRGIAEDRIMTAGHGSEQPVAKNDTEANRVKNRRIEFRILKADEGF
jgi:outer membrane protein OmpA-like peptidoglycan-associated protein/opacity protein-like surface antigen